MFHDILSEGAQYGIERGDLVETESGIKAIVCDTNNEQGTASFWLVKYRMSQLRLIEKQVFYGKAQICSQE